MKKSLIEIYEDETKESAMHQNEESNPHTLPYVKWLERRLSFIDPLDELVKETSRTLKKLGAPVSVLCAYGSIGDTQTTENVIEMLEAFNSDVEPEVLIESDDHILMDAGQAAKRAKPGFCGEFDTNFKEPSKISRLQKDVDNHHKHYHALILFCKNHKKHALIDQADPDDNDEPFILNGDYFDLTHILSEGSTVAGAIWDKYEKSWESTEALSDKKYCDSLMLKDSIDSLTSFIHKKGLSIVLPEQIRILTMVAMGWDCYLPLKQINKKGEPCGCGCGSYKSSSNTPGQYFCADCKSEVFPENDILFKDNDKE